MDNHLKARITKILNEVAAKSKKRIEEESPTNSARRQRDVAMAVDQFLSTLDEVVPGAEQGDMEKDIEPVFETLANLYEGQRFIFAAHWDTDNPVIMTAYDAGLLASPNQDWPYGQRLYTRDDENATVHGANSEMTVIPLD